MILFAGPDVGVLATFPIDSCGVCIVKREGERCVGENERGERETADTDGHIEWSPSLMSLIILVSKVTFKLWG